MKCNKCGGKNIIANLIAGYVKWNCYDCQYKYVTKYEKSNEIIEYNKNYKCLLCKKKTAVTYLKKEDVVLMRCDCGLNTRMKPKDSVKVNKLKELYYKVYSKIYKILNCIGI